MVMGAGTGGTLTGVGTKLKKVLPDVKIVAVDPEGSVLADPEHLKPGPFYVEGIGKPFVPNACVRNVADKWYTITDKESFDMAARLCKDEGLLVGGSAGTALAAAIKYAKENKLGKDHRICIIMADGVRNYVSKHVDDDWLVEYGFKSNESYLNEASKVYGKTPKDIQHIKEVKCHDISMTIQEAYNAFENGAELIPITENGEIKGYLNQGKFLNGVESKGLKLNDCVRRCVVKPLIVVEQDTDLSIIQKYFDRHQFICVKEKKEGKVEKVHVVHPRDLFALIKSTK